MRKRPHELSNETEPTLGDILSEALSAAGEAKPEYPPVHTPSAVESWDPASAQWGLVVSSWHAAQVIADHYATSFEDVRTEMNLMAHNLWSLLDTPEGWVVLGMHIDLAISGRTDGPLLRPAIH